MTTTHATATAFAIGTCRFDTCGRTVRAEAKPAAQYTPCPTGCGGFVAWIKGAGRVTTTECDGACRSAKSAKCSCECGGRNHGTAHGDAA